MKRYFIVAGILAAVIAGWYLWPKGPGGQDMAMKPEVSVVTIRTVPVLLTRDLPGRTSALRMAEIRPQVSGIITKRFFEEGGMVRKGQQLYQIDPAPLQAAFNSARAALGRAEANVKSVQAKAERYTELVKIGGVSRQEFDDVRASLAQNKAEVAIAQAEVSTARVNLDYTRVMSPISGRIGQSKVTEGALVNAGQAAAIAVVQQLDSIYVDVSRSSKEMMQMRERHPELKSGGSGKPSSAVRLLVDGKPAGLPGTLKFSDVTVNPTTGTVLLRVLFPNPDHAILPGMFVHARLEEWREEKAILVPQKSAARNVDGSVSVWVVGKDGKVNPRTIVVTEIIGDRWLVSGGLKEGEKVVYEGVMKIRPGMDVKTVEAVLPAVSVK
ncbi:MAG: efflux RND transporter periplasmic adaptor subunit [Chlorobiaceae bacterium]|nr:efflux RND transporter periplasmic adaptor subunit [Chlorobiaceae bacterium]NTV60346.1 efflux RND transporter periplasmic adaptor subunit [Chlorobiaceae bacterium]